MELGPKRVTKVSLIEQHQIRDLCSSVASGCASVPKIPALQVSESNGTVSRISPLLCLQHVRVPPHYAEIPLLSQVSHHLPCRAFVIC